MDDLQIFKLGTIMDNVSKKFKHNYKALMLDVDGTLVSNDYGGKISKKVKKSLLLSSKKITVGIASGRPLDRVTFIFNELGIKKPCVVGGGTQIVDPITRKILWEKPILPKDMRIITNALASLNAKVWVVDNTKELLFTKKMALQKPMNFFIPKIKERKANALIKAFSHIPTLALTKVVAYHHGYVALHITHFKATKEHATRKVAQLLNVKTKDIIGVGDGYNDFSLFKACGLKIAVGNAVKDLKKRADYIAPSVNEDGVAHIVEKFILRSNTPKNQVKIL